MVWGRAVFQAHASRKAFDLNYLVNLEDRRLQLAALWDMCIYCADVLPKLTMLFWSVA
jgi:hypothetical protein